MIVPDISKGGNRGNQGKFRATRRTNSNNAHGTRANYQRWYYLPDTAKEKPQEGEVVAVGPGRVTDDGTHIAMELSVGDKVIYSKYAGTEYKDGDDEYLIMRESDVLAKLS